MKNQTIDLFNDAIDIVRGADHVLANTDLLTDLSPDDYYKLASELDRACNILLVIGDRRTMTRWRHDNSAS